jgi:hypothetical protein
MIGLELHFRISACARVSQEPNAATGTEMLAMDSWPATTQYLPELFADEELLREYLWRLTHRTFSGDSFLSVATSLSLEQNLTDSMSWLARKRTEN